MRKLCYICEATQGGVRKHLRDLLRVFSRPEEGFAVHAILGDRGESGFREEMAQFAAAQPGFKFTFVAQLQRAIRPLRDMRAYAEIKELLRAIEPDVVHTHSSKAGMLGRQAAHNLGIKNVIHTPHVFPFQWAGGLTGRLYLGLERHAARCCRTLVCVGESQRQDALARAVAPAEKLIVIRNGIELPEIPENVRHAQRTKLEIAPHAPLTPVVGMVARLAPQKGVGAFVAAAAIVHAQRPDVIFALVGGPLGGAMEAAVRARMTALKLPAENFRLLGHREDAEKLYPAFDVIVLSSLYEGLPYVLLEAMAWAVPVVATDVLGSRDVVADGETGFLARLNDPAHIAARTLELLGDPALRARFGDAARRRAAREFSYEAFIAGHRRLYSEAVE